MDGAVALQLDRLRVHEQIVGRRLRRLLMHVVEELHLRVGHVLAGTITLHRVELQVLVRLLRLDYTVVAGLLDGLLRTDEHVVAALVND